ncbi:MAG: hypothetical protein QXJ68_05520 [Methanocellales archaeon]
MRSLAIAIAIFLSLLPLGEAMVLELYISPSNPYCGDIITISGKAQPSEKVTISSYFKKTIGVESGKYVYRLYSVHIPPGENSFTVIARNTKNLQVSVKFLIWITKGSDAVNGTAIVSQSNVPEGTYDIKIYGDAADGAIVVELDIIASKPVVADNEGNFELNVLTNGVPPGLFTLKAGDVERTIILSERPTPTLTPTPISNGIWITMTPTPTPTPTSTPTSTPNQITPTPFLSPSPLHSPSPSPPPLVESQTPITSTSPSAINGFEVFLALFAFAFLIKKR